MTECMLDRIAAAVLYEGYLLYPYRASAVKNRQRFNFGVIVPQEYSAAQSGTEAWTMQTECLIQGSQPSVEIRLRFLHLLNRQIEEFPDVAEMPDSTATNGARPVEFLEVDGERFQTWQEAMEREVRCPTENLSGLCDSPRRFGFEFGPDDSVEFIRTPQHQPVGLVVRNQRYICGKICFYAERLNEDLHRLHLTIQNSTPLTHADELVRDQALLYSFVSAHVSLRVNEGSFVSLLEPPEEFAKAANDCHQQGCWPVLVGEPGDRSTMLASPIILYDYPEVAAESPGDFFDGTEMDEMLMLRVMTMTDDEHHEMRYVDQRARQLLERTQMSPQEDLTRLHGTIRGLRASDKVSICDNKGVSTKP